MGLSLSSVHAGDQRVKACSSKTAVSDMQPSMAMDAQGPASWQGGLGRDLQPTHSLAYMLPAKHTWKSAAAATIACTAQPSRLHYCSTKLLHGIGLHQLTSCAADCNICCHGVHACQSAQEFRDQVHPWAPAADPPQACTSQRSSSTCQIISLTLQSTVAVMQAKLVDVSFMDLIAMCSTRGNRWRVWKLLLQTFNRLFHGA